MNLFASLVCCIQIGITLGISDWDVFSTKTTYEWATGTRKGSIRMNGDYEFQSDGRKCTAAHVNMVIRHGARWPSDSKMENINRLTTMIKEMKSSSVFQEIDKWTFRYNMEDSRNLVKTGEDEQQLIGQNTWTRFANLFELHGDKYVKFLSSSKGRSINSAKYFHAGFYHNMTEKPAFSYEEDNALMRFYDGCENYEVMVEDNEDSYKDVRVFENSELFQNVRSSVEQRLGLTAKTLSISDIYQLFFLCTYEKYLFNETTWCDIMTDEDRRVIEYSADMEYYQQASYGHPLNKIIVCPLVNDILDTMDAARSTSRDYSKITDGNHNGYLAAKIYVGHTGTTLPLLTALGLYKDDEPLKTSNYVKMANRKFRTSHIVPFSVNIAFVLYSCDVMDADTDDRKFMVKLFVNEAPVKIPACGELVCDFDEVIGYFEEIRGDKCDIKKICTLNATGSAIRRYPSTIMTLAVLLVILFLK